jgi:hypothetical protein
MKKKEKRKKRALKKETDRVSFLGIKHPQVFSPDFSLNQSKGWSRISLFKTPTPN